MKGKIQILAISLIGLLFLYSSVYAARGIKVVPITDKAGKPVGFFEQSHALIIGVSKYDEGWPTLPGVHNDIRMVREVLKKNDFNVVVIEDPDRNQMEDSIRQFINMYGQGKHNRLLFYYAGHGHTLKLTYGGDMGYIVPRDAPHPDVDKRGFLTKALDMQQFEVYAKRIQSKHALFLFDSCFSGSIFSLSRAIPEHINYKTSLPVRQFITAGGAHETVPDESIFRAQFIAALEGRADTDKDGYITGVELGEFLQKTVVNYTKGYQHPQYGKIRDRHLDQGDFVFPIKKARLDSTSNAGPTQDTHAFRTPAPMVLKGHLQINVNVPEARVIFNEKFQGTATVGDPLNLVNLSTGKITVHLQARGYESIKREVVIRQNQWTQEIFQFQKKQLPDSTQYNQDSEGAGSKNPAEMCWDSAIGALTSCQ